MSLFSDVNWDEGSDNPFGLTDGTHSVTVSDANVTRSEAGNLGLWLTFTAENRKSIRKWITLPEKTQSDEERIRNTSFLRMILKNLGIPRDVWDTLEPDHFKGLECTIIVTPQANSEYFQVKKIMAKGAIQQSSSTPGSWSPPGTISDTAAAVFSGKDGF